MKQPLLSPSTSEEGGNIDAKDDATMEATVKALIDAGTCDTPAANEDCADDAESYYHTFEYGGDRIVISSGCPDHEAEWDQKGPISDKRCESERREKVKYFYLRRS